MEIKPAIIPRSLEHLEEFVTEMKNDFPVVHVDICDGEFVKSTSWLFNKSSDVTDLEKFGDEGEGLPGWEDVDYEVDLMVRDPLPLMKAWLHAGASSFVVHAEGIDENVFKDLLTTAHEMEARLILAVNPQTDISKYESFIPLADSIQCMGISRIGFQGEPFDERVYDNMKKVQEIAPDKSIQIDGAVNGDNASELESAGATSLVVGSAIEDFR